MPQRKAEESEVMRAETKIDFEHLSVPEALKQLDVDLKIGLSSAEAQRRFAQYGPKALQEKKVSALEMFGKFLWGPMPWMIEAAAVVSILVKDWVDFDIILALLL